MSLTISSDDVATAAAIIADLTSDVISDQTMVISTEAMAYQGFDPEYLMQVLAAIAAKKGVSVETHKKNLRTMALIGTMRGSKIDTIKSKSTEDLTKYLADMVATYGLVSSPKTNKDVTLLRLAAIYAGPLVTAIGLDTVRVPTTVNKESVAPGFPKCMCVSTFGALLPDESKLKQGDSLLLAKAFSEHQAQFDKIINKPDKTTSKDRISQFVLIQAGSTLYTPDNRVSILKKVGLLEESSGTTQISSTHRAAITAAANKWDARQ